MKKIQKLKLPLWQEIVYIVLTVGVPAVITAIELFQSHSSALKISFASVGSLLIFLIVFKKFFVNHKIETIRQKIILLEHDFSIKVGDADACKQQWAMYNLFIYIYNAACILVALLLFVLFVNAVVNGLMNFKGAAILILVIVWLGIMWKVVCYLIYTRSVKEKEVTTNNVDKG